MPRFLRLRTRLGPKLKMLLPLLPFAALLIAYWLASEYRLSINPNDKLLPSFAKIGQSFWRMASEPDLRSGDVLLWSDTLASLSRLLIGVLSGALVGLLVGINIGSFPVVRASLNAMVTFLSIVPPLTLLPILFIMFGTGEEAKIVLIFVGTVFVITRDITLATIALPVEQTIKALTLGASDLTTVYRIIMPQILPRLLNTTRLTLGAAWLFLIAAEMISATDGLGYRIGLVRRYLAMDIIIPYVLWITFLGVTMDWFLRLVLERAYPWYQREE